jgi:type II secretory pathway predicted ATPase ExeA
MYTDWFNLKRLPFRLRPDADFLFLDDAGAALAESLRAAVDNGRGVIALIGEPGAGKTTMLHAIAAERQGSMSVARIQQPFLTVDELLDALCEQWNLSLPDDASRDARTTLKRFVAEEAGHGRAVLILVDEAHRMAAATLRELLALCARQPAPVTVLAGTSELAAQLAALTDRGRSLPVAALLKLRPLELDRIGGYLRHRLSVAGCGTRTLFEPDTTAEIQRYTGGTPQLINQLCDAAMAHAENNNSPRVGLVEIRNAAQELKWVEFSARAPAITGATRPRQDVVRPELDVQQQGRPVQRLTLKPGRITIGRGEDCAVHLDSQFVSRHHCQIITTAEQSFVEDLGSTNGISVNGQRRQLHKLEPQDRISVGDHTLTYLEAPDN